MELNRFSRNDDDKKKRSSAFKAAINFYDNEDDQESLEGLEEDKELALLSKKYQKILRVRKGGYRKKPPFPKKSLNKGN